MSHHECMRLIWIAVLILIGSCSWPKPPPTTNPTSVEDIAINAAITEWVTAGLPYTRQCIAQRPRVQIALLEPLEFTQWCGREPIESGGTLYACNTEWSVLPDGAIIPLLVISSGRPPDHQKLLVVHEALHWLERCSGKGVDHEHEDNRVWIQVRLDAQIVVLHQLGFRS